MGHTYTNLLVHVVFSTKARARLINAELQRRLYEYMAGVARHEFGRALEIGGTEDHVHALLSLRGNVAPADALRKWKSLSSGWVHQTFATRHAFAWQAGYAAFSVSQSAVNAVREYIAGQAEHHRRVSFDEELRAFLDRNGVPYDRAHLLD
ncbi:MAG: IS200/IS605 family transposase [Phycisphaerae bacterium]|nr:IS200/IS605 family transposase [Phycisphaerae bacterium]